MHALRILGFVHRDISAKNLLIVKDGNGEWGVGCLIDFEYLARVDREGSSAVGNRTVSFPIITAQFGLFSLLIVKGTLPFLCLDALGDQKVPWQHELRHDLESLFYVLVWICCTRKGPHNDVRAVDYKDSMLKTWNTDTLENIHGNKFTRFSKKYYLETRVFPEIDPYFDPIKPVLVNLRSLLFPDLQEKIKDLENDKKGIAERLRKMQNPEAMDEKEKRSPKYDELFPFQYFGELFVDILDDGIERIKSQNLESLSGLRPGPQTRAMTRALDSLQPNRALDARRASAKLQAAEQLSSEEYEDEDVPVEEPFAALSDDEAEEEAVETALEEAEVEEALLERGVETGVEESGVDTEYIGGSTDKFSEVGSAVGDDGHRIESKNYGKEFKGAVLLAPHKVDRRSEDQAVQVAGVPKTRVVDDHLVPSDKLNSILIDINGTETETQPKENLDDEYVNLPKELFIRLLRIPKPGKVQ